MCTVIAAIKIKANKIAKLCNLQHIRYSTWHFTISVDGVLSLDDDFSLNDVPAIDAGFSVDGVPSLEEVEEAQVLLVIKSVIKLVKS